MSIAACPQIRLCEWVFSVGSLPSASGKYVVYIDCGNGVGYLSTRSFNSESKQKTWLLMNDGERVAYWLSGLTPPLFNGERANP